MTASVVETFFNAERFLDRQTGQLTNHWRVANELMLLKQSVRVENFVALCMRERRPPFSKHELAHRFRRRHLYRAL